MTPKSWTRKLLTRWMFSSETQASIVSFSRNGSCRDAREKRNAWKSAAPEESSENAPSMHKLPTVIGLETDYTKFSVLSENFPSSKNIFKFCIESLFDSLLLPLFFNDLNHLNLQLIYYFIFFRSSNRSDTQNDEHHRFSFNIFTLSAANASDLYAISRLQWYISALSSDASESFVIP